MIKLAHLFKTYSGSAQPAIRDLSLDIDHGEFCTFVGPSGCGKTTILRMINQLDIPDSGDVYIQGVRLADADIIQVRRQIGFVMQSAALFPHRTVAQNIATVPRLAGWSKARINARIEELVALMSLDSHLLHRYPHQLSGGQQGRVAIARAIAADPPILLMDEPFAAIDPVVRERLQDELLLLQQRLQKTIVLVTHDINEAIRLGDKIAIFQEGGVLAQFDTPDHILAHPASEFVRRFIGPEPNLKRLGMIQVGQLPRHDVPLLDEALTPIASAHPPLASPLRLVLDRQRRPLHWFDPQHGLTLPVERPLASSHSLRFAYSSLLDVATGVLVHVDSEGQYQGAVSHALLQQVLEGAVGVRPHD
ncbi:ABC transporter ATP-binding protein [Klebsiella quasipneumoniae]|uniref:ATP-binding cassette domain-containing protein n=1 Tax=Klebsiella quasipneumoniae TaxID=1463165 RepID=UPI000CCABD04|nr:ABC transporter ATP-binding protein [Klebsiella quasipneumoniae]HBR1457458.1 ABC transporter ATP-binding protein [Klebsiella quasipneumoniae subsp. quasipneumoniae]MBC5087789.1 ABC transporter ATP-binding protein [Klebsiella quasipneumoniae]MBC5124294.1 ABC transporter ATP-binding protein [Klebsiella quasipneumoniae]MBC5130604.1 ABC transporter ATP-binding protein [Klebsiella quasipneumoniae]MBC5203594.1 ABC transporter ATP-binding protein [Klebsiella quasipneumoniae]